MARYDHRQVQRLRFSVESTFGGDRTGDVASNFMDLRHKPTVIMRDTETAPDETVVQRFFQRRNHVLGPDRGSCALECYWTSTGQALNAAAISTKTGESAFLEALMGGYVSDAGSTVEASPTPTTTGCTVDTGHGARFEEGQLIGLVVSGVVYPRLVTSVSTDAIEWWPALPSAPASASVVYNSQTIYLDESVDSSIQLLSEAAIDRGNIWLLKGCQGDLAFNLERGGLVSWTSNLTGALYVHDDEITTPQGGSSIALGSYTGGGPKWGHEGGCHFGPSASTTLSLVKCQSLTFNPGIAWLEVGDHGGVEGLAEWERDRGEITAEMTILHPANLGTYELYHDAMKAETDYGLLFWLGATAGGIPAICAPTMQITSVQPAEVNGLEALTLGLLVKENTLSSAMTTALQRSPFVIGGV